MALEGLIALPAAVALGLALALSGCALDGTANPARTNVSKLEQAQRSHEYPSPTPTAETVTASSSEEMKAVRDFASAYINWTAADVAARMRMLAAHSVGQARSAMELAAAQTGGDYELQRGGIANSGTIEAIAPLAGHHDRFVVVTRETTSASNTTAYQGLRPAWHVALATVVPVSPRGWAVGRWQPEN